MPDGEENAPPTGAAHAAGAGFALGLAHLGGLTAFGDDIAEPRGLLHCAPGLAPITVGRLTDVDLEPVRQAPGVRIVLTAGDIPGLNDCAPGLAGGEPILAEESIAHRDQAVFLVVAETREQALGAAKLAEIAGAPGMPVVDIDDALIGGHAVAEDFILHRDDDGPGPRPDQGPVRHLTGELRTGAQDHAWLETHVALAEVRPDGVVWVRSATQHPAEVHRVIARMLARPESSVLVEPLPIGGAFGGKLSQATRWAALAALAAAKTGRPCKLRLERDHDMAVTGKRHDFRVDYAAAVSSEGEVHSVDALFIARAGHSPDYSAELVGRAAFHADNAYFYPAAHFVTRSMRTNTVSSTAYRGAGASEAILFAERLMDQIAYTSALDPLDVRLANLYGAAGRDRAPSGAWVDGALLRRVLEDLAGSAEYRARRSALSRFNTGSPILRKGLAIVPVRFGVAPTALAFGQATAVLHLLTDGSVLLLHSGVDFGQGIERRLYAVIAAELGVTADRLRTRSATTADMPNSAPTGGLAAPALSVAAAQAACAALKRRIFDFIEQRWQIPRTEMAFRENQLLVADRAISLATVARTAAEAGISLTALADEASPGSARVGGDAAAAFADWVHGAACAEVTIDTMTGELRLDRVDIRQEIGGSLDPAVDRGQVIGGFTQGLGWLTTEELIWDAGGALVTRDFSTYRIPTAAALPADFRVDLFDAGGEGGRSPPKSVNEAASALAVSVFSAVTDAIAGLRRGAMPRLDAPATPEAIIRAIRSVVGAPG